MQMIMRGKKTEKKGMKDIKKQKTSPKVDRINTKTLS